MKGSSMFQMGLRQKSLISYFFMIFMILFIGLVSIHQSHQLEKKMHHLSWTLSSRVQMAESIENIVLTLRRQVERYLYLKRKQDQLAAEKSYQRLQQTVSLAMKKLGNPSDQEQLNQIQSLASEYIENFRNVAIRYESRQKNRLALRHLGNEIHNLLETNRDQLPDRNLKQVRIGFINAHLAAESWFGEATLAQADLAISTLEDLLDNPIFSDNDKPPEIIDLIEEYLDTFEGIVLMSQKMEEEIQQKLLPMAPRIIQRVDGITQVGWNELTSAEKEISSSIYRTVYIIATTVICASLFGIIFGLTISARLTNPITKMMAGISDIAKGNLGNQIEVQKDDELGRLATAVNTMSQQMNTAVGKTIEISDKLVMASAKQAAFVQETAAALEQISAMTRRNADNSTKADQLMAHASNEVAEVSHVMNELIDSITAISSSMQQTSRIIKSIDEISFQTNMLSLNAAIEAEKSEASGSGFAVVAEEVRKLAQRSAQAAQNTTHLIRATIKHVETGEQLVKKTGQAFARVSEITSKATQAMGEISAASEEQSQGIEHISKAMSEMETLTQENAVDAQLLKEIMQRFHTRSISDSDVPIPLPSSSPLSSRQRSNPSAMEVANRHSAVPDQLS